MRTLHTTAALSLAMVLVLTASKASAQPIATQPAAPSQGEEHTKYYGLYVLGADVAVLSAAIATKSGTLAFGGFLLSGPLVHLAHGQKAQAIVSLGLRVIIPGASMMAAGDRVEETCASDDFVCAIALPGLGAAVGLLIVASLDAALLSVKTYRTEPRAALRYRGVEMRPTLSMSPRRGLTLGFDGSF